MHGFPVPQVQINKTMKKNLIYTVAFLLCGAVFFSSCEDMLNPESNRVEYEFDPLTMNDSVYSVLGILKGVQEVGDRQVLLNELRADLVSLNASKAVIDIQELSRSEFNLESNKYLDVKDYYTIINNCNIFFTRIDTTLQKNGIKVMMPEYVAVKTIRAWTYLQLAINHNYIPYFTEPVLTHGAAEDVMNRPKLSRQEVISKLIDELLPYENPSLYPMPAWDSDGKVLKFGYGIGGVEFLTEKLFVPVRMLLGDLYLWRGLPGDYRKAAKAYYDLLAATSTGSNVSKFVDNKFISGYTADGGKLYSTAFSQLFSVNDYTKQIEKNILALIPYATSSLNGTISQLADIFLPVSDAGGSQVVASPAMVSLSERQVYRYVDNVDKPKIVEYSHIEDYETKGDLRLVSTTCYQNIQDEDGAASSTKFNNLIAKFNLVNNRVNTLYIPTTPTPYIVLSRPEQAYLRLAEALMGMHREGYLGAMDVAMTILKSGIKTKETLLLNPVYDSIPYVNSTGDTIRWDKFVASCDDELVLDFSNAFFADNTGIHSRGSGDSEHNIYYALDDINVARYLGKTAKDDNGNEIIDGEITPEDKALYVSELILDEMALELAWEGTRFGDLVRVATALGDPDVLALRIAGRDKANTVSHRHPNYDKDGAIYDNMRNENNWYIPLPGDFVETSAAE